jgi:DNA-binding HxlR family transcriptional regulator
MVVDDSDEWQLTWHHLQQGLGSKWALHVLHVIAESPRSFSDLKRGIDGISEAMVSRRLADLQEKGFIETRTVATERVRPHACRRTYRCVPDRDGLGPLGRW